MRNRNYLINRSIFVILIMIFSVTVSQTTLADETGPENQTEIIAGDTVESEGPSG